MIDTRIVMENIESLRKNLEDLIQAKADLLDPEVHKASIMLDNALNNYYKPEEKESACV